MSVVVIVGLVLLLLAIWGLALALAAVRDRLGITGFPRPRNLARPARDRLDPTALDPPGSAGV